MLGLIAPPLKVKLKAIAPTPSGKSDINVD
jgi:hypothetical protein